jgi:hypothetical protein
MAGEKTFSRSDGGAGYFEPGGEISLFHPPGRAWRQGYGFGSSRVPTGGGRRVWRLNRAMPVEQIV